MPRFRIRHLATQTPHRWCLVLHASHRLLYTAYALAFILTSPDAAAVVLRTFFILCAVAMSTATTLVLRGRRAPSARPAPAHIRRRWARAAAAADIAWTLILTAALIAALVGASTATASSNSGPAVGLALGFWAVLITADVVAHSLAEAPPASGDQH